MWTVLPEFWNGLRDEVVTTELSWNLPGVACKLLVPVLLIVCKAPRRLIRWKVEALRYEASGREGAEVFQVVVLAGVATLRIRRQAFHSLAFAFDLSYYGLTLHHIGVIVWGRRFWNRCRWRSVRCRARLRLLPEAADRTDPMLGRLVTVRDVCLRALARVEVAIAAALAV